MMFVVTVIPVDDKWQVVIAFKRRLFRYGEPTLKRETAYVLADKLDAVIQAHAALVAYRLAHMPGALS